MGLKSGVGIVPDGSKAPLNNPTFTGNVTIPVELCSYEVSTPATLATVNISNGITVHIVKPAGTIAALTLNLPSSPGDGQQCKIGTSQVVTALTMGAGANSIIGALTAATVGGFATYMYRLADTTWYRVG